MRPTISGLLLSLAISSATLAEDWPTYQHDNHRSGKTSQTIETAHLGKDWEWKSPQPPQPAWAGPAKWDAFANLRGLRGMRNYDPVFHPIAADGKVFFGSTVDDSVHCLDAATGKERWVYTTDGPIRIAPTYVEGRLYFGSDDGYAYCLDAEDGTLIWKFSPKPNTRRVLNNGRLIPLWPCRTGVLVDRGIAYFAMGMLPWEDAYLCAVDAKTGKPTAEAHYVEPHRGITMEGAMLASADRLFVPQGRVAPVLFSREHGKSLGSLGGGGGSFVLLTEDSHVLHGPGNKAGWITDSSAKSREKLASFAGGNAIIVDGRTSYLLTDTRLSAIDRTSRKPKWTTSCKYPYALILAGKTLFAGGMDAVAAFDTKTGKEIWKMPVLGKAYGLAVADGRLLVSTDEGRVISCKSGGYNKLRYAKESTANSQKSQDALSPIEPIEGRDLVGRWVFQGEGVEEPIVKDLAGKLDGTIEGEVKLARVGDFQALETDGHSVHVSLTEDHKKANLPKERMSVEAWVRVDRPHAWGGILGAVLDNGSHERGWVLGYNDRRFSFAVCGQEGPGNLTYLKAATDFEPGRWYHVAGTYGYGLMKIYVNGRLEGTSPSQKGPINYPAKTFFDIGAYHDDNEFHRLAGAIHEVRLWERVLPREEIATHYEAKPIAGPPLPEPTEKLELPLGPWMQFSPEPFGTRAVIQWATAEPSPSIFEYTVNGETSKSASGMLQNHHRLIILPVRHNTVYKCVIKAIVDGKELATEPFEIDTFFDYNLQASRANQPPFRSGEPEPSHVTFLQLSKHCEQIRDSGGIALVLGDENKGAMGRLTRNGPANMRVIHVSTDIDKGDKARRESIRSGRYGAKTHMYHVESLSRLPFADGFAGLVVAGEDANHDEALRMLAPGGTAFLGKGTDGLAPEATSAEKFWGNWQRVDKPLPKNAGVWSHQYGLPDNAAYGGEALAGARTMEELEVRWVGRPGPRAQADRNGRKPSPLAIGGKLFMQGLHRMIAIDAYNGSIHWSLEIPDFERFNVPRDCSNWCADETHVFAAIRDRCWKIDATNGNVDTTLTVLPGKNEEWQCDWGYVARVDDHLVGTAVKQGTAYTEFFGGGGAGWYDSKSGDITKKVCSDNLFVLDVATGEPRWQNNDDGLIVNPTITIADGTIFYAACRDADLIAGKERRLNSPAFWKNLVLVARNLKTGEKQWEKPLDGIVPGTVVLYMAHTDGRLVLVASHNGDNKYHTYAIDAADGKPLWDVHFPWPSDNHGKHMSRPAIAHGKVFVRPKVIDLTTGKMLEQPMPDGGCGTYALTDEMAIYRAGNVTLWNPESDKVTSWNRLRPGCWLSTIPANGMLLSPEAGGGCSCGNWMETSIGFGPKRKQ